MSSKIDKLVLAVEIENQRSIDTLEKKIEGLKLQVKKLADSGVKDLVNYDRNSKKIQKITNEITDLQNHLSKLSSKKTDIVIQVSKNIKKELGDVDVKLEKLKNRRNKISLELATGVDKQLNDVHKKLKEFTKTLPSVSTKNLIDPQSLNTLAKYIKEINDLEAKKIKIFTDDVEDSRIQKIIKSTDTLYKRVQKLNKLEADIKVSPEILPQVQKVNEEYTKTINTIKKLNNQRIDLDFKQTDLTNKMKATELSIDGVKNSITNAEKAITNFKKPVSKMEAVTKFVKNLGDFTPGLNIVSGALTSLGGAMMSVGVSAMKEAVQWEILRMKLGNFYATAQETHEMFNKLVVMAKTTPFEIKGLVQAAIMLKTFGHDVDQTIVLAGDLAAALGGDVKDAGYAVARALSGASLGFLMLQRSWGISYKKLREAGAEFMAGNKLIAGSVKTHQALLTVLKQYEGSMIRMSSTATGRLSNLYDAINTLKASAGEAFIPTISWLITKSTDLINIFNKIPSTLTTVGTAFTVLGGASAFVAGKIVGLIAMTPDLISGWQSLTQILPGVTTQLTKLATYIYGVALPSLTKLKAAILASNMAFGILGVGAAACIAVMAATEYQNYITQKTLDDVSSSTMLLTKNINELSLSFGGTKSATKIIEQALKQTSGQIIKTGDDVYEFQGKLKKLNIVSEEDILKEANMLQETLDNRLNTWAKAREGYQKIYDDNMKNMKNSVDAKTGQVDKSFLEDALAAKKKISELDKESIKFKLEKIALEKLYRDALIEAQKLQANYDKLQTDLQIKQKLAGEEGILSLVGQKQIMQEIMQIEQLSQEQKIEWRKELAKVQQKLNDITIEQVEKEYSIAMKTLVDLTIMGAYSMTEQVEQGKILTEEYKKSLKQATQNEVSFKPFFNNWIATEQKTMKESGSNWKKYYDTLIKFKEEHSYMLRINAGEQKKLDTEIANASLQAIKQTWNTFYTEQSNLFKLGKISGQEFYQSLQGFAEQNGEALKENASVRIDVEKKTNAVFLKINKASLEDILQLKIQTMEAMGKEEEARVASAIISLQKEYKEKRNQGYAELDLFRWFMAEKEKIQKEHNDRMREATIQMQTEIMEATTQRTEKADLITGIEGLNKQREEYEKLGKDKAEIDVWYYTMKGRLEEKYVNDVYKNNLAIFKAHEELYKKIIAIEHDRLANRLSGNQALKEESDYITQQIAITEQMVAKEQQQGEALKLRLLSGQKLKDVEMETLGVYLDDVAANNELLRQKDGLILKAQELFDAEMAVLNAQLSAKGEMGMDKGAMFQQKMEKVLPFYRQLYQEVLPLLNMESTELNDTQQAMLLNWEAQIPKLKEYAAQAKEIGVSFNLAEFGILGFGDAAEDAGSKATSATDAATSSMKNYTSAVQEATDAVVNFGNIQAKVLDQKTGNFMTPEQAFDNLPGSTSTWSPIGDATDGGTYGRTSSSTQSFGRQSYNDGKGWVYGGTGSSTEPTYDVNAYGEQGLIKYAPSERPFDNPKNDSMANKEGRYFTRESIGKNAYDMLTNFFAGTLSEMKGIGKDLGSKFLSNIPGEGTSTGWQAPATQSPSFGVGKPIEYLHDAPNLFDLDGLEKYMKMTDAMIDLREKDTSKLLDQYNQNLQNMELLQEMQLFEKDMTEEQALYEKQKFITEENNALKENVDILKQKAKTEGVARLTDSEVKLLEVYTSQIKALKDIEAQLLAVRNASATAGTGTTSTDGTTTTTDGETATITEVPKIPSSGINRAQTQQSILNAVGSPTGGEFKYVTASMAKYLTQIFGKLPDFVEKIAGQVVSRNAGTGGATNVANYNMSFGMAGRFPAPGYAQPAMRTLGSVGSDMQFKYGV